MVEIDIIDQTGNITRLHWTHIRSAFSAEFGIDLQPCNHIAEGRIHATRRIFYPHPDPSPAFYIADVAIYQLGIDRQITRMVNGKNLVCFDTSEVGKEKGGTIIGSVVVLDLNRTGDRRSSRRRNRLVNYNRFAKGDLIYTDLTPIAVEKLGATDKGNRWPRETNFARLAIHREHLEVALPFIIARMAKTFAIRIALKRGKN